MLVTIDFVLFAAARAISLAVLAFVGVFVRHLKRGNSGKISKMYWALYMGISCVMLSLLLLLLMYVHQGTQEYNTTAFSAYIEAIRPTALMLIAPQFHVSILLLIMCGICLKNYKKNKSDTVNLDRTPQQKMRQRLKCCLITYMTGVMVTAGMQIGMAGRSFSAYILVLATWVVIGLVFMNIIAISYMKAARAELGAAPCEEIEDGSAS